MKSAVPEAWNLSCGVNGRLDFVEEKTMKLEDIVVATIKKKITQRKIIYKNGKELSI